jgi:hypothetical protein
MGRIDQKGLPLPTDAEVRCVACGGPLRFDPTSYPLLFRCENTHALTIEDLLDEVPPRHWRDTCRLLQALAGEALRGGHALAAADLQETADRFDQWLASLRKLLAESGPLTQIRRGG